MQETQAYTCCMVQDGYCCCCYYFRSIEKADSNKCRKLHIILGYFGINATEFQPNIIIIICRKIVLNSISILFALVRHTNIHILSFSPLTFRLTCSLVTVPLLIGAQTQRTALSISNNSNDHNMVVVLLVTLAFCVVNLLLEGPGAKHIQS